MTAASNVCPIKSHNKQHQSASYNLAMEIAMASTSTIASQQQQQHQHFIAANKHESLWNSNVNDDATTESTQIIHIALHITDYTLYYPLQHISY